jgi:hypothetical protein
MEKQEACPDLAELIAFCDKFALPRGAPEDGEFFNALCLKPAAALEVF